MKLAEAQAIVGSAIAASHEPPVRLWFAQCPHVSEAEALALVQRLTGRFAADLWTRVLTSEMLAAWPATARAALIARVAALRKGRVRTEALCLLAEHLDAALLRQGFDGLLAGHSPEQEIRSGMVCSNSGLHEALLRRVPLAWKNEWCARLRGKGDSLVDPEIFARSRIDGWTEASLQRCYAELWARPFAPEKLPLQLYGIAPALPPALRAEALARVRACTDSDIRRFHLNHFIDLLTDDERADLVEDALRDRPPNDESAVAADLARIANLLPAASLAMRRRCLVRALALPTSWHRHSALAALVPVLDADERALALRELEQLTVDDGFWTRAPSWDRFSVTALVRMLQAPAVQRAASLRDTLAAELFTRADAATQDQALAPWLAALHGMDARQRLESVTTLTPWFAARTEGALPRWILSLA